MTVNMDPSLPSGPPPPHRAAGDAAVPRPPQAPATPTTPVTATPPVPGAAPAEGTAPAPAPAVPSPAPPSEKTQVSISPQGRQSVGEAAAALQRQTLLLDALNPALGAAGTRTAAGTAVLGPSGLAATGTATPAGASAEVAPATGVQRTAPTLGAASLDAAGALARPAGAGPGATAVNGPAAPAATASTARLAWPSGGVSAPLQSLLGTLVQQTTAAVQAQRVLAIQPWPAALLAQVDGSAARGSSGGTQADGPPPLQTWLVRQGVVQTPEGPRGVSVTLRVPAPWLQALEQTQAAATPTRSWQVWLLPTLPHTPAPTAPPLQAAFGGPSQALQSGTFALALESSGAAGARTSALLTLEVQPLLLASAAQAGVYGREVAQHLRQDPWLQMAALQASGQVERDEDRARHGSAALCDTPGCPYLARAACVQPFCAALQVVPQVASVQAPSAPGIDH